MALQFLIAILVILLASAACGDDYGEVAGVGDGGEPTALIAKFDALPDYPQARADQQPVGTGNNLIYSYWVFDEPETVIAFYEGRLGDSEWTAVGQRSVQSTFAGDPAPAITPGPGADTAVTPTPPQELRTVRRSFESADATMVVSAGYNPIKDPARGTTSVRIDIAGK
jgi:hypothetical protein